MKNMSIALVLGLALLGSTAEGRGCGGYGGGGYGGGGYYPSYQPVSYPHYNPGQYQGYEGGGYTYEPRDWRTPCGHSYPGGESEFDGFGPAGWPPMLPVEIKININNIFGNGNSIYNGN